MELESLEAGGKIARKEAAGRGAFRRLQEHLLSNAAELRLDELKSSIPIGSRGGDVGEGVLLQPSGGGRLELEDGLHDRAVNHYSEAPLRELPRGGAGGFHLGEQEGGPDGGMIAPCQPGRVGEDPSTTNAAFWESGQHVVYPRDRERTTEECKVWNAAGLELGKQRVVEAAGGSFLLEGGGPTCCLPPLVEVA